MDTGADSYRRFLDGEESAFEDIMRELFHGLVFFINGFVHDVHAAEDIAIDTFSDLVVHRHRYNFKVSLKTYLYMVGRSRALEHLRRRKVIAFTALSEAEELAEEAALEELVLADERKRRVNAALARLPEDMRRSGCGKSWKSCSAENTPRRCCGNISGQSAWCCRSCCRWWALPSATPTTTAMYGSTRWRCCRMFRRSGRCAGRRCKCKPNR